MNRNILGGIIILAGIAILFVAVFFFKDGAPGGLIVKVQFDEAKGLKPGDAVYMQGVSIGEVRELGFENGQVVAGVKILRHDNLHVPADSYFFIWPHQMLTGKQCIIVEPGTSAESVRRGALLQGESSKTKILLRLGPKKVGEVVAMLTDSWEG